jgi:two-component system phosphate regulon sensor histidine kinase PhoR
MPRTGAPILRIVLFLAGAPARVGTIRIALAVVLGVAAVVALVLLVAFVRGLVRPLRRITAAVERIGEGDLDVEVPEGGTRELATLARTIDRMRRDFATRVGSMLDERAARDVILSSLEEGVVLFDSDGSVVYENARVGEILGGPIGRLERVNPASLQQLVASVRRDSGSAMSEVVAGPASRALLATAVPASGDHVVLVLRDVTGARMIDAVRRDFVANASHELKTPAASIRAIAETILSTAADDPEAIRHFAEQLEREAVRLSRIISDLLDLSRVEGETAERGEVRLDRVAADEGERFRSRAEGAGLSLSMNADRAVLVRGSVRDIGLLVQNLVQNAIQYTRVGGQVDVLVSSDGPDGVLEVRDTGIGIPSRDRERIFERFYRVDRARSRETGGTGLGLSIVRHVVENHGGTIAVESELGRGSTFTVRLPLAT